MQTGYQVESQPESLSAMAVAFAQNPKNLQSPNDVFHLDPFACQLPIRLLFRFAQPVQFAVFLRQNYVDRFGLQTPISQIGLQCSVFSHSDAAQLKQPVVVRLAFAEKCCRDLFRVFGNNNLRFQTVSLALATVKPLLFFFGRSIKLSVTSTIVYLMVSSASSRFLPGKANLPDLIKISSMRRTRRETFDSCSCQSLPRWNIVRYSRQNESVNRTWFSMDKLLFLPRVFSYLYSRTTSHIAAKVSLVTPHKRLRSPCCRFLTSS